MARPSWQWALPRLWEQEPAGLEHGRCEVEGAQLHYARLRTAGAEDRLGRVLLVPGFTAGLEDFHRLAQLLAGRGWDVVSVSQRGQSESSGPSDTGGYRPETLAADLIALLDHLGWERAHLLGHSFGGVVATAATILFPSRIASLTMWNSGPFRDPEGFPIHLDAVVEKGHEALLAERFPGAAEDPVQAWYAERLLRTEGAQLEAALRIMLDQVDRTDELAVTGVPVLVAHGARDLAWPQRTQRELAERLHSDYAVIAEAGHCAHWDRPEYCAGLLDAFWKDAS